VAVNWTDNLKFDYQTIVTIYFGTYHEKHQKRKKNKSTKQKQKQKQKQTNKQIQRKNTK
jgi:hypothetical protein